MTRVSLNEIEFCARKAAGAIGWPFGFAEEIGRAAVWSAVQIPAAISSLLDLIESQHRQADCTLNGRTAVFARATAPSAVAAFDLLAAGACDKAVFRQVSSPLGLIGFGGSASVAFDTAFRLRWAGGLGEVAAGHCRLSGELGNDCQYAAEVVSPKCGDPLRVEIDGAVINDAVWHRLQLLAARTLVPATSKSRETGAGAGVVDRD
ncbi:MAG: DUF3726 domain-containing protein [Rhodobacteraceae bacterium]|nr:DUF3726 domain-containing protein [Paracoccaceae bacterium]